MVHCKTIGCFLPLPSYVAPSDTMEDTPQGGGSWVRFSMDPPSSVSEICGVFINQDLSSATGATKGNSTSLCCFGSLLQSSGQQLTRGLFRPGAGGYVRWSMALVGWVGIVSPRGITSFKRICTFSDGNQILVTFLKNLIFLKTELFSRLMCMCESMPTRVYVCVCLESRRGPSALWRRSFRYLWTSGCGCWDQNYKESPPKCRAICPAQPFRIAFNP